MKQCRRRRASGRQGAEAALVSKGTTVPLSCTTSTLPPWLGTGNADYLFLKTQTRAYTRKYQPVHYSAFMAPPSLYRVYRVAVAQVWHRRAGAGRRGAGGGGGATVGLLGEGVAVGFSRWRYTGSSSGSGFQQIRAGPARQLAEPQPPPRARMFGGAFKSRMQ